VKVNKILVIRFSSLGDIVLLTPIFRELKNLFPQATLDFLSSTTFATVCGNNPHIDHLITLERKTKGALREMVTKIKNKKYDLVFDAHQSLRSRLFLALVYGWFSSDQHKIYRIDKRSWQRNLLLFFKINRLKKYLSQREAYCQLLREFADLKTIDTSTEIYPCEADKRKVEGIITEKKWNPELMIAIGAGASFKGKCWPEKNYLELIEKLQKQNYKIVLLGTKSDSEPFWLYQNCTIKPLNLAGKLNFLESAEILRHCKLVVTNDSAIGHLAEAVGTPSLSIFGPTTKEFGYAPFLPPSKLIEINLDCRPCSRNGKGKCHNKVKRQCLTDINVSTVFQNIEDTLSQLKTK
jgi:heptosyltransferase-2